MKRIQIAILILIISGLSGCGFRWQDSNKFIAKLSCGISSEEVKVLANTEEAHFLYNMLGENAGVVAKNEDYLYLRFNKENKLVEISKPNWTLPFTFILVKDEPNGLKVVKDCLNEKQK